jgi:hypothetical protein
VTICGKAREFIRVGDEGTRTTYGFCPECGVTVHYSNSEMPDMIAVPVGAFATTDFPQPSVSVYDPDRCESWINITATPLTRL